MQIGESFIGTGPSAAHVNTVLGDRSGPAGAAWATALATPTAGHAPFVAVLQPGVPTRPPTLFVNKATVAGAAHANLTWGPAQAGIAAGVMDAVTAGVIDRERVDDLVVIAAVWVDPQAGPDDADAVYRNNRLATARALQAGAHGRPTVDEALAAAEEPANPFYTAPGGS
ncbi:formaldehyde-activating enzyme [Planosporangium thailandense]|uniref:Formaldehyde-activating enzyme n=1 Tax=Planosporangium thailandense TaxID=765197 RepID=A0ABX0Y5P5_9ACTN|nr:formaldehyde-activating enzyme [Planosporangium thailandense]NJC73663.1 formaldehyde-activating enzyme [Planosporangium thailandense]